MIFIVTRLNQCHDSHKILNDMFNGLSNQFYIKIVLYNIE